MVRKLQEVLNNVFGFHCYFLVKIIHKTTAVHYTLLASQ
jgi:hypothetical protein